MAIPMIDASRFGAKRCSDGRHGRVPLPFREPCLLRRAEESASLLDKIDANFATEIAQRGPCAERARTVVASVGSRSVTQIDTMTGGICAVDGVCSSQLTFACTVPSWL